MGISVGELFVSLGVKGSEKSISAIANVTTGLSNSKSMALETKAAIIGAIYAFEQMTAASNNFGTNISNNAAILNMSTQTLQRYGYVAKLVGSSNEEMESTFKSLQSTMAKINLNEGAPKWLSRLAQVTGTRLDANKIKEFTNHPEELIQLFQKYSGLEKDIGWRNEVLSTFLPAGALQSGVIKGMFNRKNLGEAPISTSAQIKALDANRQRWTKIGAQLENDFRKLNSDKGITEFTESLLKLVLAIDKLETKFGAFEKIGKIFSFAGGEFDILSGALRLLSGDKKSDVLPDLPQWMQNGIKNEWKNSQQEKNVHNNVNITVHAPGNNNAHDIANKAAKAFDEKLNKKLNSAGRPVTGGSVGAPR